MKSRWSQFKGVAMSLRKKGMSLRDIENKMKIPRSTLSGWFKDIELSQIQRKKLLNNWKEGLRRAREKAAVWHKKESDNRRQSIRCEVEKFASGININKEIGELIMATFYLAEGGKTENYFAIANSSPKLLEGIVNLQRYLYKLDESKFRCALHLRKDQNEGTLKHFWSTTLRIPKSQFIKTQFDKRTTKKTYDNYKGVCVVIYYNMALQRRIIYLGEKLLDMIKNHMGG